jgi:hypothetical protein
MVGPVGLVTASLSNGNEFTSDERGVIQQGTGTKGIRLKGNFNLSVSGTWTGTVTLQRSFNNGASWFDVNSYTANTENWDQEIESGVLYRVGFKTGDHSSGTADVRISK